MIVNVFSCEFEDDKGSTSKAWLRLRPLKVKAARSSHSVLTIRLLFHWASSLALSLSSVAGAIDGNAFSRMDRGRTTNFCELAGV
eukprot:1504952-Rhodomonas_salina.1